MKNGIISCKIEPSRLIIGRKSYKMKVTDKSFIIHGFSVVTNEDNSINKVVVYNKHPNVNPKTNEFCLPSQLKDRMLNEYALSEIKVHLYTYNLDSCYFKPWLYIEWEGVSKDE